MNDLQKARNRIFMLKFELVVLVVVVLLFFVFAVPFLDLAIFTGPKAIERSEYSIGLIRSGRHDTKIVSGFITGVERTFFRRAIGRFSREPREVSTYRYIFTVDGTSYAKQVVMTQYGDTQEAIAAQQKPFQKNDIIEVIFETSNPERGEPVRYAQYVKSNSANDYGTLWTMLLPFGAIIIGLAAYIRQQWQLLSYLKNNLADE